MECRVRVDGFGSGSRLGQCLGVLLNRGEDKLSHRVTLGRGQETKTRTLPTPYYPLMLRYCVSVH